MAAPPYYSDGTLTNSTGADNAARLYLHLRRRLGRAEADDHPDGRELDRLGH